MVLGKATKATEAGVMPTAEAWEAMDQFQEELVKAGFVLVGEGLMPSSTGVRVRFSGEDRIVTDAPFHETKELLPSRSILERSTPNWQNRGPSPGFRPARICYHGKNPGGSPNVN